MKGSIQVSEANESRGPAVSVVFNRHGGYPDAGQKVGNPKKATDQMAAISTQKKKKKS